MLYLCCVIHYQGDKRGLKFSFAQCIIQCENKISCLSFAALFIIIKFDQLIFFFRELLENSVAPKQQRLSTTEVAQLIQLLIIKDTELKDTLKVSHYFY